MAHTPSPNNICQDAISTGTLNRFICLIKIKRVKFTLDAQPNE